MLRFNIILLLTTYCFNVIADDLTTLHKIELLNKKASKKFASSFLQLSEYNDPLPEEIYYAKFDLNNDKSDEYFFYIFGNGWCGSYGCAIEILSKHNTEVIRLLKVISYAEIYILKHKTNGYHDISFFPKTNTSRYIFHWHGKSYH